MIKKDMPPQIRTYEPTKNPISLGEACEEMYQMCEFTDEPIWVVWNGTEIRMKNVALSQSSLLTAKENG